MTGTQGIRFFLSIPSKVGEKINVHRVYERAMQTCPGCSSPLVLFNEKFSEIQKKKAGPFNSPPKNNPQRTTGNTSKDQSSPQGNSPRGQGRNKNFRNSAHSDIAMDKESRPELGRPRHGANDSSWKLPAVHGGWYCSRCGIHIIPDQPARSSTRLASRSMEDLQHPLAKDSSKKDGTVGKVFDNQYEDLETNLRTSFVSLLSHIREHFSQKEKQLQEYQIDLCQREKVLRANEEHLNKRITKLSQNEIVLKNKMNRVILYKESMLSQLEARRQQLVRYEQSLRAWESQAKIGVVKSEQNARFSKSQKPSDQDEVFLNSNNHTPATLADLYRNQHQYSHKPFLRNQNNVRMENEANRGYFGKRLSDQRQSWSASHLSIPTTGNDGGQRLNMADTKQKQGQDNRQFWPLFVKTSHDQLTRPSSRLLDVDDQASHRFSTTSAAVNGSIHPHVSLDSGYTSPNMTSPYQNKKQISNGSIFHESYLTDTNLEKSHNQARHLQSPMRNVISSPRRNADVSPYSSSAVLNEPKDAYLSTSLPLSGRENIAQKGFNNFQRSLSTSDTQPSGKISRHQSGKKGIRRVTEI